MSTSSSSKDGAGPPLPARPPEPAPSECPKASTIPGLAADDPLQSGVELAMQAVWMFLDSDFERVEQLLHRKRHSLLYASEGYAAIQYLRAMMTFTQEAMSAAQEAAESTINLAVHYRKPRGVGSIFSGASSRASSRNSTPEVHRGRRGNRHQDGTVSDMSPAPHKGGELGSGRLQMDSPRRILQQKKAKRGQIDRSPSESAASGSDVSLADDRQEIDPALLDAKYGELLDSDSTPTATDEEGPALDHPRERSWASGIATMADSVIGVVRSGTQAIGITKPDWHMLKAMTPTQRHAELVHAEAYLLRAMLNIATGDGMLSLLKEGWHVRSAYATYRNCYAYIQDAHTSGEKIDAHFVSGTYLGMGVFNLVLSMLPAKLLRFIELVGFTADRDLGLELLAIAAGWRTDPLTASLMGPPPPARPGNTGGSIHPCGYGLRSEFCSIVLQGYHVFLCNDLFLGYPNFPLVDVVLKRALQQHPNGLIYVYFEGRFLMTRTQTDQATARFNELIHKGQGAVDDMHLGSQAEGKATDDTDGLVAALAKLTTGDKKDKPPPLPARPGAPTTEHQSSVSEWRQLQYLGYWERSLCHMVLGHWLEAAEGFHVMRTENNWNKAVYTYALACCMWEYYLTLFEDGVCPEEPKDLSEEQRRVLDIVSHLMELVPTLKRKVAGKSIPVEKFVIRKANKFQQQGGFLMRPGLELLHTWNLASKVPYERLLVLRSELDREIAHMAQFRPVSRAPENPYRHIFYYDDLALLLLTKADVLRELAYPSFAHTFTTSGVPPTDVDYPTMPDLEPVAYDTLMRLLRLMPLIQRDHYLAAIARFYLGNLFIAAHPYNKKWIALARQQWKCILGGKPLSSPPYLSLEEYQLHIQEVSALLDRDSSADAANEGLFAAPGCLTEERILQESGHSSLSFYDGTWQVSEWRYTPYDWADSRKYSLENALEVRVFNANNRLDKSPAP
ncbi:hypothetical protein GGF46_004059 [Coemansia sp. RSA 552]|nr:hypothetical protein GGF46_004059 [Coemansia sp. RSA 552]